VPDSANAVDSPQGIHKIDKLPPRPLTAKSRTQTPQDQTPTKQSNEKPSVPTSSISQNKDDGISSSSTHEQVKMQEQTIQETKHLAPAVTIDPPTPLPEPNEEVREIEEVVEQDDVEMRDVPAVEETQDMHAEVARQEAHEVTIPPPPPGPGPNPLVTSALLLTEEGPSAPEPQKWLLPPITPELKGRKCLVLDLDETLVHSSFKVCFQYHTFG
jgi:RNA polymerase II subunit A small phosphatase-like protein